MKRVRQFAVVVGLSLLSPPVAFAGPNSCYDGMGKTCVPWPKLGPPAPQGATAVCRDGSHSFSPHRAAACSERHGGVSQWLSASPGY